MRLCLYQETLFKPLFDPVEISYILRIGLGGAHWFMKQPGHERIGLDKAVYLSWADVRSIRNGEIPAEEISHLRGLQRQVEGGILVYQLPNGKDGAVQFSVPLKAVL
jgi:hypothetical protein